MNTQNIETDSSTPPLIIHRFSYDRIELSVFLKLDNESINKYAHLVNQIPWYDEDPYSVPFHIASLNGSFLLLPRIRRKGANYYKYRIGSKDFDLELCRPENIVNLQDTNPPSPPLRVCFGAHFLVSRGIEGVLEVYEQICKTLDIASYFISSVEVYVDFEGWEPDRTTAEHFKCRARKERDFANSSHEFTNSILNGLWFGGRHSPIKAKIYNKSLEVKENKKLWYFDYLKISPDRRIWRIEFSVYRGKLREFGIETFDDLLNNRDSLWRYCTGKWLTHRDGEEISPAWLALQSVVALSISPLVPQKLKKTTLCSDSAMKRIYSAFVDYAAASMFPTKERLTKNVIECLIRKLDDNLFWNDVDKKQIKLFGSTLRTLF